MWFFLLSMWPREVRSFENRSHGRQFWGGAWRPLLHLFTHSKEWSKNAWKLLGFVHRKAKHVHASLGQKDAEDQAFAGQIQFGVRASSGRFRKTLQTCLICSEFVCRPFHEMETRRLAEAPACCVVMILMWLLSTLRSCIDSTKQYATIVVTKLQIHTRCVTYRNHIGWKDLQSPYKIKKLELRWISLYLETQCSGIQRDDDYNPKHLM